MRTNTQSANRPAVSAVVPCRNELAHIENCLRSLLEQEEPPGGFEVVVVDGMSEDGTREILQRLAMGKPRVRLVDNPARITPCAMNLGIAAAQGEWIAIMGSHNRYASDYLIRCLEAARATGADNVGGSMFTEGENFVQRAIAAAHHSPFSVGGARWHKPDYEGPAETVFGGFYKRKALERIGLFDEELVRNQDDELNLRLIRAGGKIWQTPRAKSWHRPRGSLGALFRQYMQYGYWKVRIIQKHKRPASWRHLVPAGFLVTLAVLAGLSCIGPLVSRLYSLPVELWRWPAFLGLLLGGTYLSAVVVASAVTAQSGGWRLFPILPLVFACYHFGYGYGFLRGLLDFVVRKTRPGPEFVQVTRAVSQPQRSGRR
jgi:glycosyltransferase involved in cell wall biosynthesis